MYEPLFELNCSDRDIIYNKVVNNLNKNYNKSYIIYVRANLISNMIHNCNFNENIFKNKFKLINKFNIGLFPLTREIYFFENLN